jgi:hypothetical protein
VFFSITHAERFVPHLFSLWRISLAAQGTRTCSLFFPLVLLFFVGALHVSLFISLLTSLYKHHEAAISLEHIYLETP